MAIYEVTLFSSFFGNNCVNRWNYVSSGGPGTVLPSFGLAWAMGMASPADPDTIYGNIRAMCSTDTTFLSFAVKNLYDPEDFYSGAWATTQTGFLAGPSLSPINAYGFRSNQVRLDVDRATKRFVGVTEGASDAGGAIQAALLASTVQPLAIKMGADLTFEDEGVSITFIPAVLSREKYTTPSGKSAYRKYATEAEQLSHTALNVNWEAYANVRSQTSRQYGRGF